MNCELQRRVHTAHVAMLSISSQIFQRIDSLIFPEVLSHNVPLMDVVFPPCVLIVNIRKQNRNEIDHSCDVNR